MPRSKIWRPGGGRSRIMSAFAPTCFSLTQPI
nr:MAG TPA: hypothetical protein [Caudoviricetes sp.]